MGSLDAIPPRDGSADASPTDTDATGSDPTTGPAARLSRLTYDGESLVDGVTVSGGTVGVTTHRVLALTPEAEGPNLQAVERPNVEDVAAAAAGDAAHGVRALRFGVYALALYGGSYLVNFDSVSTVEPSSAPGAGEVVSMAVAMTGILSAVDDVLRIAGVLVLLVALVFLALYGRSRDRHLRIEVAGDDPVRVPMNRNEHAPTERLAAALEKASNPSAG